MGTTHLHTCMLCEAVCGLEVEVEDGRAVRVRGDDRDPFSRGHICPKAAAIEDVRTDPDRVLEPLRRGPGGFAPVPWGEALAEAGERIARIQREHGRHAVAIYLGNPTVHTYSGLLGGLVLSKALRTRSRFSATSVDQLPHMLASLLLFGHQILLPVPDLDRTAFLLVLGANPAASNGSLMTAGCPVERLEGIRARGGRIVVIDPRRTETAALADAHHFIRPGGDAYLLCALLHTVFAEGLARPGRLAELTDGIDALAAAVRPFAPEAVEARTGIAAAEIRALARAFAAAPSAAAYGRVGVCTQEHGGLAAWLVVALNLVTGNLDRPGGMMFPTPAVDLARLTALSGHRGSYGRYRSRVRGLPEFGGELPMATFADELETPGAGQIRALVTFSGNPVLSAPNGARVERALAGLDYMVSIDVYRNETTRHAHLILPTSFGFERDHFDLVFNALAVRNTARYVPALFPPAGQTRHDWDVLLGLARAIGRRAPTLEQRVYGAAARGLEALGARRFLDGLLRAGPHRLSVKRLLAEPHGVDLGPLEPRLPGALFQERIDLVPAAYAEALRALPLEAPRAPGLALIGRRSLRSNNSWMHNSQRLVKGKEACTLLMHPEDAAARALAHGARVRIRSRTGEVTATLEVSEDVMRGVVSLPHGWGHSRPGTALRVASAHAGASLNDLTDELAVEPLGGTAAFSGVPVEVSPG